MLICTTAKQIANNYDRAEADDSFLLLRDTNLPSTAVASATQSQLRAKDMQYLRRCVSVAFLF